MCKVEKYNRRRAFFIVLFGRFIVSARNRLLLCWLSVPGVHLLRVVPTAFAEKKLIPLLVEKCVFGESVGVQLVLLKSQIASASGDTKRKRKIKKSLIRVSVNVEEAPWRYKHSLVESEFKVAKIEQIVTKQFQLTVVLFWWSQQEASAQAERHSRNTVPTRYHS